jgi:phospholipase/lecithinase/hemolysin
MVDIKNVVILGDSMSDIGNKWHWPTGELGRLFRAMRVNETGRFSDGKNWTDFLVEWATGETLMWGNRDLTISKSTNYRTLSGYSVLGVESWDTPVQPKPPLDLGKYLEALHAPSKPTKPLPEIRYVNYAMGGAIVTSDWSPKFGALTYLRSQVEDYLVQRRHLGKTFTGPTLHVIWIGLNDFVTAVRPDYDPEKIKTLPDTLDYGAWSSWSTTHPKDLTGGVGVFPAVAEIQSLVELINSTFPEDGDDHHFAIVDLPSVYNAIRFIEGLGDSTYISQAKKIDPIIQRYNAMLESLVQKWPETNAPDADHVHLVRMSAWMDHVSENLGTWELSKMAQDRGVRPFYGAGLPPQPKKDPVPVDMRRRITTSDLAHPTEAVYSLIARYFVSRLLENGYTLGRLDNDTWPQLAPYNKLPFDIED